MYCENCGKKLIRGYQFCIECGTPVPPETEEDEAQAQNEQPAEAPQSEEMPGIKPTSEDGTLVFCPTCGMRMQQRTDICEKCGMNLTGGNSGNSGSSVPLVNADPLGSDFGGISDNDIAQIDQFVNNSGFDGSGVSYDGIDESANAFGGGNLNSEIEALNRQFANLNSSSSEMPAISAPTREPEPVKPEPVPEPEEPSLGTFARRVDNFSMEAGMPETQFLTESGLPVISGGEMTEPDVPVQLEQNYDDINIDVKQPAPAYTEPAYSEPAAEIPAYSEPAAETPAYTEPEDEKTTFMEPAPAVPAEPVYSEPAVEEPAYTEPEDEKTTFMEPINEAPIYAEPEDEKTTFMDPLDSVPAYSEPAASYPEPSPIPLNRPAPPKEEEPVGPDLGKLVYCRNCGQDMYEKEEVCKNCGSPNKWNVKPLKHSVSGGKSHQKKESFKLFGVIPIPTLIGAAVVVIGIIALVVFTNTAQKSEDIIDRHTSVSTPSTTSAAQTDNSDASVPDDQPVNPVVTTEQSQPEDASSQTESDEPVEPSTPDSEPVTAEVSAVSEEPSQPEASQPEESQPDTSKPEETPESVAEASKPTTNPTTKATTKATPKPVVTTPKPTPVSAKPTATVSSEDKQRSKMLNAFEAISAEVGKLHVYAQATTYALEEGKTRTFYTDGMAKTLSSGKSNAASLFKNAEPSSSQLSSAYKGLQKLYDLYTDYYTYVTTSTDGSAKYESNEASKWDSFNSAVKNSFSYKTLQTANQTASDISRTYAEIMSSASSAASNAVSQFTTVQNAVTALKSGSYSDSVMSTIYNDKTSNILKAAGYYQTVLNYYGILSSGVPTEYTTAKSRLSSLSSDLDELLGIFTMAGYNSLSGFKSECSASIKSVSNSISALNKAI